MDQVLGAIAFLFYYITPYVAVEVNLRLVPHKSRAEHRLAAGDRLEIVTLVGGG